MSRGSDCEGSSWSVPPAVTDRFTDLWPWPLTLIFELDPCRYSGNYALSAHRSCHCFTRLIFDAIFACRKLQRIADSGLIDLARLTQVGSLNLRANIHAPCRKTTSDTEASQKTGVDLLSYAWYFLTPGLMVYCTESRKKVSSCRVKVHAVMSWRLAYT